MPFPGRVLPQARWKSTEWRDDGRPFEWMRRGAPRVLDAGCGDGRYLIGSAGARPDWDHLGIDRVPAVIARAVRRADRRGLANIRFVAGDARTWLLEHLPPDSVDEIHVYHPDPYGDPAEQMVVPEFFERAWRVARRGGLLVLQTDHKAFGRYLFEAMRKHFDPEVHPGPWPDAPLGRTRREILAGRKGLAIRRLVGRRRDAPLAIDFPPPYVAGGPRVRRRRLKKGSSGSRRVAIPSRGDS